MKVTVIVSSFNHELYVGQCLQSLVTQSYPDVELIVADKTSTDMTPRVIQKVQQKHPFQFVQVPYVHPYCWDESKDYGMSVMTGEWFTIISADDFVHKDYVKNTVDWIKANPGAVALQSPMVGVKDGVPQQGLLQHNYASLQQFKRMCMVKSPVNTPTVWFHRSLYEQRLCLGKPAEFSGTGDYQMYCEMADAGVFIHPIPTWTGFYYRWHPGQATWAMHKNPTKYEPVIQKFWKEKWGL